MAPPRRRRGSPVRGAATRLTGRGALPSSVSEGVRPEEIARIRRVVPGDWKELRELRLRSLRTDPLAFGSTLAREERLAEVAWRERADRAARSERTVQWVVARPDGTLLGTVTLAETAGGPTVFAMWVEPDSRRQGLGARLLDTVLARAAQRFPGRPVRLEVNPRQAAAVDLYRSREFAFTGSRRPIEHTEGEEVHEMLRAPPGGLREGTGSPSAPSGPRAPEEAPSPGDPRSAPAREGAT